MSRSVSDLESSLHGLNIMKGAGPDDLPPKLFGACKASLTWSLQLLLNLFLDTGIFSSCWKKAFIVLLHKSSALNKPISIPSKPCKLLNLL